MQVALILLVACGGPSVSVASPVADEPEPPPVYRCERTSEEESFLDVERCPAEARDVIAVIREAAVLGATTRADERNRLFTRDAELTLGRREAPDTHDVVLDRERIGARQGFWNQNDFEPDGGEAGLRSIEVAIDGERAHARAEVLSAWGADTTTHGEAVELVRAADGWRINRLREWPLAWTTEDGGGSYGDDYFEEADARVAPMRAAFESSAPDGRDRAQRRLISGLFDARRYAEALPLATEITERAGWPNDWRMRARIEVELGRFDERSASAARIDTAGFPTPELAMQTGGGCDIYEVSDENDETSCSSSLLAQLGEGVPSIAVMIGDDASPYLLVRRSSGWVVAGSLIRAPSRFELVDLVPGDLPELRGRFNEDNREPLSDEDGDYVGQGFFVCALSVPSRCVELYDRVERDGPVATAAITFADGAVTVRARRGRDRLIVPGTRPLAEMLSQ